MTAATSAPTAAAMLAPRMRCRMRRLSAGLHIAVDDHSNRFFPRQDVADRRFAHVIVVSGLIHIAAGNMLIVIGGFRHVVVHVGVNRNGWLSRLSCAFN